MLDCLIFSKNRACQLDLLLRTIRKNFNELKPTNVRILYLATNEFYNQGYLKLRDKFPAHEWIQECNFTDDVKNIVSEFKEPFALTLVDDEVIVNPFPILESFQSFRISNKIHTISLRMHPEVDWTYTSGVKQGLIDRWVYRGDSIRIWDWTNWDTQSQTGLPNEAGYPSCINSHIYPRQWFQSYIKKLQFSNANSLEGMFNNLRHTFKPHMVCFTRPKSVSIANNLVQTGTNKHSDNPENSAEFLNDKFLSDYVIDEKPFQGLQTNTPTFEYEYEWKLEHEN